MQGYVSSFSMEVGLCFSQSRWILFLDFFLGGKDSSSQYSLKECTAQKDIQTELHSVGLMPTLLQQYVYCKQQSGIILMLHSTDVRVSALQHKLRESKSNYIMYASEEWGGSGKTKT